MSKKPFNSIKELSKLKELIAASPTKIEGLDGYKVVNQLPEYQCIMCLDTKCVELREKSLDANRLDNYHHIPNRYLFCTSCASEWVDEELIDWNFSTYKEITGK